MASDKNGTASGKDPNRLRAWTAGHRAAKAKIEQRRQEAADYGNHSRGNANGPTAHQLAAQLNARRRPEPEGSDVRGTRRKEDQDR